MPEAPSFQVGEKIAHPDFGPGEVRALIRGGRVVTVMFDGMPGAPWNVPREELQPCAPQSADSVEQPPEPRKEPRTEPSVEAPIKSVAQTPQVAQKKEEPEQLAQPKRDQSIADIASAHLSLITEANSDKRTHTARQALEALRMGVVPRHHLETYTIGRDAELERVRRELVKEEIGGTFLVVFGDYGTGKTHFLELAEDIALDLNYLTARATLDSREVLPSKPRRIYRSLARGIRYPDLYERQPIGLAPLLERAASDKDIVRQWSTRGSGEVHPYLGPALAHLAALAPDETEEDDLLRERLMGWIEGEEVASNVELWETLRRRTGVRARLYALRDHRTVTHLYTLILGGLAELARQVGYAGLLITVDEAEFYSALGTEDREFAEILLKTFAAACLDEEDLRFEPAELPRGGATVHRQFGYRYKEKQSLHAVFALTHDPAGEDLLKRIVNRRCFLELSSFGLSEYRVLAERVLALYRLAGAELELQTKLASPMAMVLEACHGQGVIENPRQALKFVTEIVDIARHAPSRLKPVLVELKQRLGVV